MKIRKYGAFLAILVTSVLHYATPVDMHDFHIVYQRLFYVPIIILAYWHGSKWGLTAAAFSALSYIPHILVQWAHMPAEMFNQYVEIVMFFVIGSLVGILSDRQKRQQKQIQQAYIQMHRMDKLGLLGQLAAGLAHEIRNPLGSLIGSDEILADSLGKDHPKYEFIEILQKEHRRLRDKLNEFLSFARPAKACIIPNDLNRLVLSTVKLSEKQIEKSNCQFELKLEDGISDVPIDGDQMKQILLNLILNSCQAMPEGGKIIVSTILEKQHACISVEDQGNGINEEIRNRIFDPFFTTKENGTGLGLSIVKQLLETVNGNIEVCSSPNGSQFKVRIPLER